MMKIKKIHRLQANNFHNFLNFPCYEFFLTFHDLELSHTHTHTYIYIPPNLRITILYIILMTCVLQILTK
jgi:hypothetical protein